MRDPVRILIHLGSGEEGERRKAALEALADELTSGNMSAMIQKIAEGQLEVEMTDTVLARGWEWSSSDLYDSAGWDPHDVLTDEQVKSLGDRVRNRFHELAEEAGYTDAFWTPQTSEVIGPVGSADSDDLERLRDQATQEIFDALIEGDIFPVAAEEA